MATNNNYHHHHHRQHNGDHHHHHHPNRTSSKTGTLYFAYGSNLSPHQMQHRCLDRPEQSAVPVAIARLDRWKWVICERGYANIVSLERREVDRSSSSGGGMGMTTRSSETTTRPQAPPLSDVGGGRDSGECDSSTVWGVLYNMTPGDVAILDRYEGHDEGRNRWPVENGDPETVARTPFLQGNWDYNKWYIDVTVTKWLQPPSVLGLSSDISRAPEGPGVGVGGGSEVKVKVLAYVDELRTGEGPILKNYVGRMNRAIEESVALGLPRRWVENVMRRWVTPGIFPKHGYVGTDEGYVPKQEMIETESSSGGEVLRRE